ncbi:hypothetical protein DPMN_048721 [Dreissena polymorpha]|uniref:Uncharacterized protein n=1 Tax=Dreissena polymorpha TaxID=45954 RepID=A0A9D4DA37_DREPO|nr:hypothetical protein DPMN_048721 [Dreissena polymorpha]
MISLVAVQSWILLFQKLVRRREDFRRAYHLLGRRQNHLILWSGRDARWNFHQDSQTLLCIKYAVS